MMEIVRPRSNGDRAPRGRPALGTHRRFVRGLAWLVPLVALASCSTPATNTILDLDCGASKLRFQEDVVSDINHTQWSESLLFDRGAGWTTLDQRVEYPDAQGRTGAEAFSRLLPSVVAFQRFPFDDARRRAKADERPPWAVFVDPAKASRSEYDAISACLARNLMEIDRAFAAPRRGEDPGLTRKSKPDRYPQLTSIIYAPREREFYGCGGKTLGRRWDCQGGGYIKTVIGSTRDHLLLCAPEPPAGSGVIPVNGTRMDLGQISGDERTAVLWPPCTTCYAFQTLVGSQEPRKYYGSCRDGSGESFL